MNLPSNLLTPTLFANNVSNHVSSLQSPSVKVNVYDREWINKMGMGCFESVTRGSNEPPVFLEMIYKTKEDRPFIALVGKAVCFDTGGISLKPPAGMEQMKADMGGAAAVSSAFWAIVKMNLDVNVVCVTPACFNMPSGTATNPGDVVTAMNGKTVEVINTDAEGRLILADALTYVQRTYKPSIVLDVATLTGAIDVALGHLYCGVFSNDNSLWESISESSKRSGEGMWRMPLNPKYKKKMESDVATIKNVGDKSGGSCTAAIFLNEFIENDVKWGHLDMAGLMHVSSPTAYQPKGMSGACTRTLIEFLRNFNL
eukprot:TRINITY_DN738_c0_g1_i1.p1 TRINITY_DN738_c0_g1~~TRINITY_DN738_c0_g1_i1.p1  ORF type:complete len:314 (-),score=98.95 TRINITY_DN738_c0_g1_i1:8-949(-)